MLQPVKPERYQSVSVVETGHGSLFGEVAKGMKVVRDEHYNVVAIDRGSSESSEYYIGDVRS